MSTLTKGTLKIGSLTAISRVLGYIRDATIAAVFGASYVTDIFFTAFLFPNLLRSFVAEGALTSAFVPSFSEKLEVGIEPAQKLLKSVTSLFAILTTIISVLGIICAPQIITFFAPGFVANPEHFKLAVILTRIMFPYVIFVSFVSISDGSSTSSKIFGASAFAQIIMNLFFIISACIAGNFDSLTGVYILSIGVLIGGLFQVFSTLPFLKKAKLKFAFGGNIFTKDTKLILLLMLPAILGASAYQIKILVTRAFASLLPTGNISWLFYAERLFQLPIGIFTISLASVLLPLLSRDSASGNQKDFSNKLSDSLRYTSFILIPISFWLYCNSEFLISLLFERKNFTANDSIMTANILRAYCFGIWSFSATSLIMRAFLAEKNTLTPSLIGFINLFIHIALCFIFVGSFFNAPAIITKLQNIFNTNYNLEASGLALASSISSLITLLISAIWLKLKRNSINYAPFLTSTLKSIVASIGFIFTSGFGFFLSTVFGFLVFLLLSKLLKNFELEEVFKKIFLR